VGRIAINRRGSTFGGVRGIDRSTQLETEAALKKGFTPSSHPVLDVIKASKTANPDLGLASTGSVGRGLADQMRDAINSGEAIERAQTLGVNSTRSFIDYKVNPNKLDKIHPVVDLSHSSIPGLVLDAEEKQIVNPFAMAVNDDKYQGPGKAAYIGFNSEGIDPLQQAQFLAHEYTHAMRGHTANPSKLSTAQKEIEAEAGSYAAMNRLYPYSGKVKELVASGIAAQNPERSTRLASSAMTGEGDLMRIAESLVPEVRKPFEKMLPGYYKRQQAVNMASQRVT